MANPTTNIGMTKPTVGGSTDTWGTTINENVVDIIDALFSISGTDVTMSDITFNSLSMQETGSGTDTVKIQAPSAVTTAYTLTMPAAVGSTNQVLSAADGSGTLAWTTPEVGDITSVADATNGGMTVTNGTGPDVTLGLNFNDLSAAAVNVATDSIAILDADDSGTKKESIADLATAMGGTGLTGASGTLAVDASQTQVTALGTVITGTWSADTVAVNKGGTGLASYAAGDVIYASGSTTLAKLAKGSDTEVLTLASGVPTWAAPTVGDITGVTAGTGLSGGGTSGTVTLNVEAAQTQITSVGALGAGSITSGFGAIDVGSSSIDGGTITGTFSGNITGNVTGNCSGTAGSATGNAATATALATARAINGTDFDGTAAITVTAAAGTVTGATLNSGVTASSLTSVGTLTSVTTSGDVTVAATQKLYLDGGGNSFLTEASGGDRIEVHTGGAERLRITDTDVQCNQNLVINATQKLFLDGGSNTYLSEYANDRIGIYCNSVLQVDIRTDEFLISQDATFNSNVKMNFLPTSDPGAAGTLYNDSGTMKISAG
jgi:hypothetical protein